MNTGLEVCICLIKQALSLQSVLPTIYDMYTKVYISTLTQNHYQNVKYTLNQKHKSID